jgi:protein Xni
MNKLLTIDALQILRRAYESFPDEDPAQKAEQGLRAAAAAVRSLIEQHGPSHLLTVVEAGGPSWRHALHAPYRSSRKPMPEALAERLPAYLLRLGELGTPVFHREGMEAVDVIATACMRWLEEDRGEVVVCSAARELLSLLPRGVQIWDVARREWHDAAWLKTRWDIAPEMILDFLAICGDPDDDIPGVARVGPKTAARLLNAHPTLEAIFAGPGTLLDGLGRNLRAGQDSAMLSRRLVTPKTDMRLGLTWRALQLHPPETSR